MIQNISDYFNRINSNQFLSINVTPTVFKMNGIISSWNYQKEYITEFIPDRISKHTCFFFKHNTIVY